MEAIDIKEAQAPRITVVAVGGRKSLLQAARAVDMLVITQMLGQKLPAFGGTIDSALKGALTGALDNFEGHAGSLRLLDMKLLGLEFGSVRYILVVGLGDPRNFHSSRVCGFTEIVMAKAALHECDSIGMLFSPHRLTDDGPSLSGSAAIIRCRSAVFAETPHRRTPIEIKLICTPQAKPHLLRGLEVQPPRCSVCVLPTL